MKKHQRNGKTALGLAAAAVLLLGGCAKGANSEYPGHAGGEGDTLYEPVGGGPQGETYLSIGENRETAAEAAPAVTFSLKVDTAAYGNVARYLNSGQLPPKDAVRTEELLNYFRYEQALEPEEATPFGIYTEIGPSPFRDDRQMALVRVRTPDIDKSELGPCSLTFLIDTSGSMDSYDKLPLLKTAFGLLTENLTENDRVSIVTYAGSSQVVLDGASGEDKTAILDAIYSLDAGGSTAGAGGIQTAYELAERNFRPGGNNRVILATDGDFNVGISDTDALASLIGEKRDSGVYLSVLGFGTGNLRDDVMETLSKNGNGNYAYIDTVQTAKKVLVEELGANLYTVADDVKAQVVFDPERVRSYRLIGYENRILDNEDFEDDGKDAGEIGAGTDVVALFELQLHDPSAPEGAMEVRIRYKDPGGTESRLVTKTRLDAGPGTPTSTDFGFACSVAAFGHLLRGSEYTGNAAIGTVLSLAQDNVGRDPGGYRQEFVALLKQYQRIAG